MSSHFKTFFNKKDFKVINVLINAPGEISLRSKNKQKFEQTDQIYLN